MEKNYKLTIGIISYNRPIELARSIMSLLPLPINVEVVVCDDKSPKIVEIENSINPLLTNKNIRFISNKQNLGYDRNLFNVIQCANSDFVLLLGDDDYLEPGSIDYLLNFIDIYNNLKCGFVKFRGNNEKMSHRNYNLNKFFPINTLNNDGTFIYNSILFSGLLFSKSAVMDNEFIFRKYFNSIYIQVAIFIFLSSKYGTYFIGAPGVIIGGDGENGFGFNEASVGVDVDLKDRSSIISNLAYHKRLFDVIKKVEYDININIYKPFIKEYKIRSIKAIFSARMHGRKYFNLYWKKFNDLNIYKQWELTPFFFISYILPKSILSFVSYFSEKILITYRKLK
jgi:hypothetical protein